MRISVVFMLLIVSLFGETKEENLEGVYIKNMVFVGDSGNYLYFELEAYGSFIEKSYEREEWENFGEYRDYLSYRDFVEKNSNKILKLITEERRTPLISELYQKVNRVLSWSKEFDLGLPEELEEFKKIEGIVTNYDRKEFEKRNSNIDTSNFYFSNTEDKKVTYIPAEIGELANLIYLNLKENSLESVPAEIGELSNLIYLNLEKNSLRELPEEIGKLSKLESLLIYQNRVEKLPESIENLESLKFLNLGRNGMDRSEISEIKKSLPNCRVWY
jgi:Leucine-rich repeat (LRR) protein